MMRSIDVDGNGLIDYNEFVAATMQLNRLEQEELLQRAFRQLDADGSGSITVDELSAALAQFNLVDDAKAMMALADVNGDGTIDYREFVELMRVRTLEQGGATRRSMKSGVSRHGAKIP
jgi:calcium-dependent protein kinase